MSQQAQPCKIRCVYACDRVVSSGQQSQLMTTRDPIQAAQLGRAARWVSRLAIAFPRSWRSRRREQPARPARVDRPLMLALRLRKEGHVEPRSPRPLSPSRLRSSTSTSDNATPGELASSMARVNIIPPAVDWVGACFRPLLNPNSAVDVVAAGAVVALLLVVDGFVVVVVDAVAAAAEAFQVGCQLLSVLIAAEDGPGLGPHQPPHAQARAADGLLVSKGEGSHSVAQDLSLRAGRQRQRASRGAPVVQREVDRGNEPARVSVGRSGMHGHSLPG
eukprot:scaffold214505_cov36-Prasinocladus_malaysianus.AAC.1